MVPTYSAFFAYKYVYCHCVSTLIQNCFYNRYLNYVRPCDDDDLVMTHEFGISL